MGEILGVGISHSPLFGTPLDDYNFWKNFSLKELEAAGGGETLNWFGLVGAMAELNHKVAWSSCLETFVFNATKVSVVFRPD